MASPRGSDFRGCRVLVTGGAGFIGGHLALQLSQRGASRVVVLDNLRRGRLSALDNVDVEFRQGDIRNPAAVTEAMAGADIVFHLAAQANVLGSNLDPDYAFTTNVQGTVHVFAAALRAGVQRVVFPSSREVYGQARLLPVSEDTLPAPKNLYGASKAAAEAYCSAYGQLGLEVVVLRLSNVYGPGDRDRVIPLFIDSALRGLPLRIYGQEKLLDLVPVAHVADALCRAASCPLPSTPLNIGSGRGTSLEELAAAVLALTGSASPVERVPARSLEVDRFVADIDRAARHLDLPPVGEPLSGLADVVDSMRSELADIGPARAESHSRNAHLLPL